MLNNENGYLNVTIKSDDGDNDSFVSIVGIFKKLKKYFIPWLVLAVVTAALTLGYATISKSSKKLPVSALVGFTFAGIEEGLAPDGNAFDVNTMKNPAVIEAALTKLGEPLDELEMIRQNISIKPIIPTDALDRITTYKSIYENGSSSAMAAAQAMLDTKYYPTQFKIVFDYSSTSFDVDEAVEIFNMVLDCYRDYFFENYGYNQALGSAVLALNYADYDYAEAVDVFDTTLSSLEKYVSRLSVDDVTRFRSNATGYTFSDLLETIRAIRAMDLEMISSYVTSNNVTKDKETLITYYQYRVESLTRSKAISQEKLASITESIAAYTKDTVIIMGGDNATQTQYSTASEQYDNLIQEKITTQSELSTSIQQINYYNTRIAALGEGTAASGDKIRKTEKDLLALNDKINKIIDSVNKTADEYYENVSLANAYSVLVSASSDNATVISVIKDFSTILILIEGLLILVYLCVSFVTAIIAENKNHTAIATANDALIVTNAEASEPADEEAAVDDDKTEKTVSNGNNTNNNNTNNKKKR